MNLPGKQEEDICAEFGVRESFKQVSFFMLIRIVLVLNSSFAIKMVLG